MLSLSTERGTPTLQQYQDTRALVGLVGWGTEIAHSIPMPSSHHWVSTLQIRLPLETNSDCLQSDSGSYYALCIHNASSLLDMQWKAYIVIIWINKISERTELFFLIQTFVCLIQRISKCVARNTWNCMSSNLTFKVCPVYMSWHRMINRGPCHASMFGECLNQPVVILQKGISVAA